jgi:hypothetical protein
MLPTTTLQHLSYELMLFYVINVQMRCNSFALLRLKASTVVLSNSLLLAKCLLAQKKPMERRLSMQD